MDSCLTKIYSDATIKLKIIKASHFGHYQWRLEYDS